MNNLLLTTRCSMVSLSERPKTPLGIPRGLPEVSGREDAQRSRLRLDHRQTMHPLPAWVVHAMPRPSQRPPSQLSLLGLASLFPCHIFAKPILAVQTICAAHFRILEIGCQIWHNLKEPLTPCDGDKERDRGGVLMPAPASLH